MQTFLRMVKLERTSAVLLAQSQMICSIGLKCSGNLMITSLCRRLWLEGGAGCLTCPAELCAHPVDELEDATAYPAHRGAPCVENGGGMGRIRRGGSPDSGCRNEVIFGKRESCG